MYIVLVHIHVKAELIEQFKAATFENAKNSVNEAGIVRFDVIQQIEDPARFTLVEVYHTPDDQLKHRDTTHYQIWKDTVGDMMVEPRQGVKYMSIFPDDSSWM
jgi:(4S)-4-hydroxy-5-phosphonooxypentane-2,3-dione isomerase